jgi:hypothetical protein
MSHYFLAEDACFVITDMGCSMVKKVAPHLHNNDNTITCNCRSAPEHALIMAPDVFYPEMVKRLDVVS